MKDDLEQLLKSLHLRKIDGPSLRGGDSHGDATA